MPRNLYGPDHESFRESVQEFVERTLKPRAEQMIDRQADRAGHLEGGRQAGPARAAHPRGVRRQPATTTTGSTPISAEVISGFNAAVSSCFGIHSDVCPPYLVDLGTEEQKQRWLPPMAAGEKICAIAMTEPGGAPTSPR